MTQPSLYTSFDVSLFDLHPRQSFSTTDSFPSIHEAEPQPTEDDNIPVLIYTTSIRNKNALLEFTTLYQDLWRDDCTLAVVTDDPNFEKVMLVADSLSPNPEIHYLATSVPDLEATPSDHPFDFIFAAVALSQDTYTQFLRAIQRHLKISGVVLLVNILDENSSLLDHISTVQIEGFQLVEAD